MTSILTTDMTGPHEASGNRKTVTRMHAKKHLKGCVYAAALLAIWAAPGFVGAQTVDDAAAPVAVANSGSTPEPSSSIVMALSPTPTSSPTNAVDTLEKDDDDDLDLPEPTEATEDPQEPTTPTPTDPPAVPTVKSDEPTTEPTKTQKPTGKVPTPTTSPAPIPTPPIDPPTPTRPTIRTNNGDPTTNDSANANKVNGVSPTIFVGLAAMCTVFLALWSRRSRSGAAERTVDSSSMSGMATTSSKEKSGGGDVKVQYSRIGKHQEEDEGDVEDDDAEFGGRGSWDDWENNNQSQSQNQNQRITIHSGEDNEYDGDDRGHAKLTNAMEQSSFSSVIPQQPAPRSYSGQDGGAADRVPAKASSPPPSQRGRLKDLVLSEATPPKSTSAASSSSSSTESYEVVQAAHAPPPDLLSFGGHHTGISMQQELSTSTTHTSPPPLAAASTASVDDDLFSQFGMVPTFKKPAPLPLNPFASSSSSSSAVPASDLFAATDDLEAAAADVSNEWGDEEDDDWVQGL